ncbi:MAG: VanW family protein [Clostridiaceae bacterium]|nr:VanW family protein [Clostridiaceae bacterium]
MRYLLSSKENTFFAHNKPKNVLEARKCRMKWKRYLPIILLPVFLVSCTGFEIEKSVEEDKEDVDFDIAIEEYGNPSITIEITGGIAAKEEVEIGSFETPLLDKSESRVNNIKLAARKLDGYKIKPGKEFSFNRVVGKRTMEKGYKVAPIIILSPEGPKGSEDIGGGVCQLSSTLYSAVNKAGLKVTERHPHSKKVPYIDEGYDATVDFGRYDLKFVNTRSNPIKLNVIINNDSVSVKILEDKTKENRKTKNAPLFQRGASSDIY